MHVFLQWPGDYLKILMPAISEADDILVSVLESPSLILQAFPIAGLCSGFPGYSAFGTDCYRHYNERVTQSEAEKKCQTDGGHLASVHSEEEQTFVVNLAKE